MFLFCSNGTTEESIDKLEGCIKTTDGWCFSPSDIAFVIDARKDFQVSFHYAKGIIRTEYAREKPYYLKNVVRFNGHFKSDVAYEEECVFDLVL